MDAVRAADADRVAVLLGAGDDGGERPLDAVEDQPAGVLDLERERGVDDVRGRQPVMEPASLRPELLADRVDEGRSVVIGDALDLGNALRRRDDRTAPDLGRVVRRNRADLGPRLQCRELDVEPTPELALVRPDPGHGRTGVPGDHWLK